LHLQGANKSVAVTQWGQPSERASCALRERRGSGHVGCFCFHFSCALSCWLDGKSFSLQGLSESGQFESGGAMSGLLQSIAEQFLV
jgi:hypothetical protein